MQKALFLSQKMEVVGGFSTLDSELLDFQVLAR